MKTHPYLRAYMAGIFVPTLFLLVIITVVGFHRYFYEASWPLERALIFPLAIVPNAWGAWNMLRLAMRARVGITIGLHGALLPLVLVPLAVLLASALDLIVIRWHFVLAIVPVAMIVYYLVWKYAVGFLNDEMGIA